MEYFVISASADGITVSGQSKEELERKLEEQYWGPDVRFLDGITDMDPNYWGEGVLIIKGEIKIPKPVEVVTSYEI